MADKRRNPQELYQGHRPHRRVADDTGAGRSRETGLALIGTLCDPDTSIAEIQRIVETNPILSHQILSAGGAGAASGLCRPITSIRHAVVLLGRRRLQGWIFLTHMTDIGAGSAEELAIALTRARMCELLVAHTVPDERDAGFTVGLVSGVELITRSPRPALVAQLGLGADIGAALSDRTGRLGTVLADALACECGTEEPGSHSHSGPDRPTVQACYAEARQWAADLAALVDSATG